MFDGVYWFFRTSSVTIPRKGNNSDRPRPPTPRSTSRKNANSARKTINQQNTGAGQTSLGTEVQTLF